jgi:hypothetical protein
MSGWNSLQSVDTLRTLLQVVGCLVAVLVIAAGVAGLHYRNHWRAIVIIADRIRVSYLPRWRTDTDSTLHNAFAGTTILGIAALLALVYGSFAYGQRKNELLAADRVAQISSARAEADAHHRNDTEAAAHRHAAEVTELRQQLRYAESRRVALVESLRWEVKQTEARGEATISRLETQLAQVERRLAALTIQRRLTMNEKDLLIETLRPFAGQKVSIAAIDSNDDDKAYVTDFVEVFEAAGWEHPNVTYRRWDRDPIGIEITLNEADGRAGRVNVAIGALINVVRKLGLTDGNTIYMNGDIPAGQVEVKIGKKLVR